MAGYGHLHPLLYESYVKCFPEKTKAVCQRESDKFWNETKVKHGKDSAGFSQDINRKIEELNVKAAQKKSRNILSLFTRQTQQPASSKPNAAEKRTEISAVHVEAQAGPSSALQPLENEDAEEVDDPVVKSSEERRAYSTPAQDKRRQSLNVLKARLNTLLLAQNPDLAPSDCGKQIKDVKEKIRQEELKLRRNEKDAERKRKSRVAFHSNLKSICDENPEIAKRLKHRDHTGRPPIETDQPGLLEAIIRIASFGGGADTRRRSELIRHCRTLDDLTENLKAENFIISRSATYLRLIPRRINTPHGKRHVHGVPVKLVKASADEHRSHPDTGFAVATIRQLESLSSFLGPKQTCFLSQDDKARVPLGITAANKQAPLLTHMDYPVILADHDFAVASRHKLIPSVYGVIVILPLGLGAPEAVTYSGPTYVAIRSGKHSSSTAATHAADLKTVFGLEEFKDFTRTEIGTTKPVLVISVDGGPDENPRSQKVMEQAIRSFRDLDLDALFVVTNAPGRSAFNRVERRMAPLSSYLSGLILPYDHFGNHLDSQRRTVDPQLELANFEAAGKVLGEVWSETVIDGHPVLAEYVPPGEFEAPELPDALWLAEHVRQSQYLLQVRKCTTSSCCGNRRSSLRSILPDGFLPPPMKVVQNNEGFLQAAEDVSSPAKFLPFFQQLVLRRLKPPSWAECYGTTPYDLYCPTVQTDLKERCCTGCGLYHPSKKAAQHHQKALGHGVRMQAARVRPLRVLARRPGEVLCESEGPALDWMDEEDVDVEGVELVAPATDSDDALPLTEPLGDWVASPWIEGAEEVQSN